MVLSFFEAKKGIKNPGYNVELGKGFYMFFCLDTKEPKNQDCK